MTSDPSAQEENSIHSLAEHDGGDKLVNNVPVIGMLMSIPFSIMLHASKYVRSELKNITI